MQRYTDVTETVILSAQCMNPVHGKRCQSTHTIRIDICEKRTRSGMYWQLWIHSHICHSLSYDTMSIVRVSLHGTTFCDHETDIALTWLLSNFNSTISGKDVCTLVECLSCPTYACSQVRGPEWLGCHAGYQEVSRCRIRGKSENSITSRSWST